MLVMVVMTLAVSMLAGTITSTAKMGSLQLENSVATEAARERLEFLRIQDFEDLFVLFNSDPADDPDGAGTAPGAHFAVQGLQPREGDADGMCGRIRFPEAGNQLREDLVDDKLGMPRDLNMDGEITADDARNGYLLIPVEVRIEWQSRGVDREYLMHTVYVRYEL